jgi:hypothetical protein
MSTRQFAYLALAGLLVIVVCHSGAWAQRIATCPAPGAGTSRCWRAATAGESYARGLSDVIRSSGVANLRNSEATKTYAEARSIELDNRVKATQTYFEMRRMHRSYRDAERGPRRHTNEDVPVLQEHYESLRQLIDLNRQWHSERTQRLGPPPLSPAQFDPHTGVVSWPTVLQDARFTKSRARVDALFAQRSQYDSGLGSTNCDEILKAIRQMKNVLRQMIGELEPDTYIAAKRFLGSVAYEARFARSRNVELTTFEGVSL